MSTALIVEDDRDQAWLAARLVRLRGIEPVLADCARAALEQAREVHPDLILLDVGLPDADGFEVCRRLRAEPETLATPIVMLTALDAEADRRRGFRVGANVYLTKPYEPEALFRSIDAARAWRIGLDRARIQGEITVELNSETSFLQEVDSFLASLYRATPLSHEQILHLRQGVMEIGQNAIEWGNRHRVEALVRLTYRVFGDRVEILVRDQGAGFDHRDLPHAARPGNPTGHLVARDELGLREGGFGLLISRGMLDELRFNDVGNEATLIKRFRRVGAVAAAPGPPRHHSA